MADHTTAIEVEMRSGGELPPMQPANFFHFSISGPEIEMRMGVVDIFAFGSFANKARESLARGEVVTPGKISVDITHRIFLSPQGFQTLQEKVNEMAGLSRD